MVKKKSGAKKVKAPDAQPVRIPEEVENLITDLADQMILGKHEAVLKETSEKMRELSLSEEERTSEDLKSEIMGSLFVLKRYAEALLTDRKVSFRQYPKANRVINFLNENGRKRVQDIVREIGTSPERLVWMTFQGLLIREVSGRVVWYSASPYVEVTPGAEVPPTKKPAKKAKKK